MILVIRKEIFSAFRKNAIGYPLPLEDRVYLLAFEEMRL
jgi:hypothetical protein